MTWNVYVGAALDPLVGAFRRGNPDEIVASATAVWYAARGTDFRVRAEALADLIAAKAPDLVGLQEVALFRTQFPSDALSDRPKAARKVDVDYLKVLVGALRARGHRYRVACVRKGVDVEAPVLSVDGTMDVRYTDRDVILARKGVATGRRRRGNFEATLPMGDRTLDRSWVSVDAKVGGAKFRFVSAHLEDGAEDLQRAQLAELLAGPARTALPTVLAGAFHCDGDGPATYAPAVHADVLAAGFLDAWAEARPGEPGETWGHSPDLADPDPAMEFRLDYVFLRNGASATGADLVGEDPADMAGGLWPSDHAGLAVDLLIP
jgi:endonuclease/exonuclease/phosphatase family metal-dependent hydrolase